MTRARTNKLYRTFSKGLITEAGYLTYPEDASSAEMNTILSRKGNRSRRLGIDFQDNFAFEDIELGTKDVINEFVWGSVNNDPNVTFAVVQLGSKLFLYTMNENALSSQKKSTVIDLSTYKIPTAASGSVAEEYASFSAGMGYLFVAHRFCDPFSVEYKPETDTLVVVPMIIQIRDFEGVYDGLANDEEPNNLTPQHHYNLKNQGWVRPGTKTVVTSTPTYPNPSAPADGSGSSSGGSVYYDPYTGTPEPYEPGGGGKIPWWKAPE